MEIKDMIEANRYKLGIFVISGVIAIFAIFFTLGLSELFKPKLVFSTLFKESVQGLDSGTQIKYRGVTIGKVKSISISAEDKLIRVDMDVDLTSIRPESHIPKKERPRITDADRAKFFREFFTEEIKKGLRCRLEPAGITGMKYVEIDYYELDDHVDIPYPKNQADPNFFYIPSTPSLMSGLRTSLSDTLARIASIDFKGISDEVTASLKAAQNLFKNPDIPPLIEKMNKIAEQIEISTTNLNNSLPSDKINHIVAKFSESIEQYNKLAERTRELVEASNVPETSESFRLAARSVADIKNDMSETLSKMNEALDTITEFISYLDEDPGSVIQGKRKKEHSKEFMKPTAEK